VKICPAQKPGANAIGAKLAASFTEKKQHRTKGCIFVFSQEPDLKIFYSHTLTAAKEEHKKQAVNEPTIWQRRAPSKMRFSL